jgi:hypothetical protein
MTDQYAKALEEFNAYVFPTEYLIGLGESGSMADIPMTFETAITIRNILEKLSRGYALVPRPDWGIITIGDDGVKA